MRLVHSNVPGRCPMCYGMQQNYNLAKLTNVEISRPHRKDVALGGRLGDRARRSCVPHPKGASAPQLQPGLVGYITVSLLFDLPKALK